MARRLVKNKYKIVALVGYSRSAVINKFQNRSYVPAQQDNITPDWLI